MRKNWPHIINSLLLLILLYVSCGVQTTLWYQFFGHFSFPLLWLILVTYIILYRPPRLSLFLIYAMGYIILTFSALSLGMILINFLILYFIISNIKTRFYWGGVGYFSLLTLISAFVFDVSYLTTSWIFEPKPAEILFWDRLGQLLLTPLFAIIYYALLKKIDSWTLKEDPVIQPGGLDL